MSLVRAKSGAVRGLRGVVPRGLSTVRPDSDALRAVAFAEGLRVGGGRWWPSLDALTRAERDAVRRAVAERITYDVSMRVRFPLWSKR